MSYLSDNRRYLPHTGRALALYAIILLIACDIKLVDTPPGALPYRTAHFEFFYDSLQIDHYSIEQIGLTKERLLEHVTAYLGVTFSETITVIISDTVAVSYTRYPSQEYLTVSFALSDNGHETAHAVTGRLWGPSMYALAVEGCAVAASYDEGGDAFSLYCRHIDRSDNSQALLDSEMIKLREDILTSRAGADFRYTRAGAFVHYLKEQYGTGALRGWFISTTYKDSPSALSAALDSLTGSPVDTVIAAFRGRVELSLGLR